MAGSASRFLVVLAVVGAVTGCARYKPPLPPDMFAPKSVADLTVTASEGGVRFAWVAPDEDRRGKELKFIDGYAIQRKTIARRGDETDPKVHFETIGFVKDKHVQVREELRAAARAEGKIGRSIESPEEHTRFTYLDATAKPATTYIYQVVPQNQGGTDGAVSQFIRVSFAGAASDVAVIKAEEVQGGDTPPDEPRRFL